MAWPQADGASGIKGAATGDAPGVVLDAAAAGGPLIVPGGEFLLHADYVRQGPDLKLVGEDGAEVLVVGYFSMADPPALQGDTGLRIGAEVAAKLAGPMAPGQYAQTAPVVQAEPVAQVQTVSGEAVAIRADGTRVLLAEGSPIFQGDVLQTGPGAALALVYVDGMTMQLDADTRMVIDQLFYDPAAKEGAALFSLVEGAFMSLSGEIAKLGPDVMKVQTPTGTIGIRGTNIAASHIGITQIVLLENPDETVGALIFFNDGGFVIIDELFANVRSISADFAPASGTAFGSREEALSQIGVSSKAVQMYDQTVSESQNKEAEILEKVLGPEAGPPSGAPAGDTGSTETGTSISGIGVFTSDVTGVTLTPLSPEVIEIVQTIVGNLLLPGIVEPEPPPVAPVAIEPEAIDDAYDVNENLVLSVTAADGVLDNDSDANGDVLTVSAFDALSAAGGAVVVNSDGSFTYAPAVNFSGADSFSYTVADGNGGFDIATVAVTVIPSPPPSDADVTGFVSIESDSVGTGPTEGVAQLLLNSLDLGPVGASSDAFLEVFLGLSAGSLDALAAILAQGGQSVDATEGSAFMGTLSVAATVGDLLTFDYNFLTDEAAAANTNDFAFAVIEGQLFPLADTNSTLAASGTSFDLETGYQQFTHPLGAGGTVTFAVGVVDVGSQFINSGLLLDNIRLNGVLDEGFEGGQDLTADAGDDALLGGPEDDVLAGGPGADFVIGGRGADVLAGGLGPDLLRGDRGPDVLTGGSGADRFEYQAFHGGGTIGLADLITDFQDGTDLILLTGGLAFGDLTIDQTADVTGGASNDTVISISATAEFLAILVDIDAGTTIDNNDFV